MSTSVVHDPNTKLSAYRSIETFGTGTSTHRLICDDNLTALGHLHQAGETFDLVFVDPPYNTGRNRDAYRNSFDTQQWKDHLLARLDAVAKVMSLGASMAITIDSRSLSDALSVVDAFCDAHREWWYDIVTITSNPSGSSMRGFRRSHEFLIFVHTPSGGPKPAVLGDHWGLMSEDRVAGTVQWNRLLKSGIGHTPESSPGCFYPVFIDRATGTVVGIGDPVDPKDYQKFNDPDKAIATCWPIRKDGSLGRWRVAADTARFLLERGFVTTGRLVRGREERTAIKYLTSGVVEKIDQGIFEVTGYDDVTGAAQVVEGQAEPALMPSTVWVVPSHNYSAYGSWLVRKLVPGCTFSYPKSIYAMEDVMRFFAQDTGAKILDVYAGSGTVAHAVMLLNATDGGHRDSVSITLNEVGGVGHDPQAKDGVFHGALVPRMKAVTTGKTAAGTDVGGEYEFPPRGPISNGLEGVVEVLVPRP